MERRRSGRGGWGRYFGISSLERGQNRGGRLRKAIKPCGTYRDTFPQSFTGERVTTISRLVGLTGIAAWKPFPTQQLRADQNLWDLQAPASVADAVFGRNSRCAARSRDALGDSDACRRRVFRILPFAVDKRRGSNPGS